VSTPVSIVFLNFNRIAETTITLGKLLKCKEEDNTIEIIAVDNGSSDGTKEFLSGMEGNGIRTVLLAENHGIRGYNSGFEIATGEIIIVLDDDSHIEIDCIRRTRELFDAHNDIGIIAFKIIDSLGMRFNTWHIPSNDVFKDSFAFVGCGFAIRKDLFSRIGFYPVAFFLYHNEIYVSVQAKLLGYRVVYAPCCVAVHRTSGAPRNPSRRIYYTLKNSLILIWMYYPMPQAIYLILSRLLISYSLASVKMKWGIATKALVDFIADRPQKAVLQKEKRKLLKPFFYQNSIIHRIFALLQSI
jgi:GT2 family glycosyltransferase